MAVSGQVPETGLPLPVSAQLVAGFAEAVVEAQVVSDGVFPAVRSRLEEREVLSGRRQTGLVVMTTTFRKSKFLCKCQPSAGVGLADHLRPSQTIRKVPP